ncbi:hypothetical protein SLE2022_170430 [Rubroshorea leprosula]
MATRGLNIGLVMVLVTLFCARTMAQSGTSGCTTVIISLAPCLNYVSGASSTPTSSCCSQLASIVKSQPACLCSLLNGSSLGVTINQTQALALLAACNVQTPPVSECNELNGLINFLAAVDAPAGSPQGSEIAPSTGGSSVGVNVNSYFQLVLIFLLGASYVATSGKF